MDNNQIIIALLIVAVLLVLYIDQNSEGYHPWGLNRYSRDRSGDAAANPHATKMLQESVIVNHVCKKEYALNSVSLNGKTLGYIRIRPRVADVMVHLRVPNRGDYQFILEPVWATNQHTKESSPDCEDVKDADDIHMEKEAFSSAETAEDMIPGTTVATNAHGGQRGWYPHAAGYSMRTSLHSNTSIASASHQELLSDDIRIEGPSIHLEGYDKKGGQGVMLITLAADGKLHLHSTILNNVLLDIERKKMPHYHFVLEEI